MKINWGGGIAIFYSLFVLIMLFMVYKSTQNKSDLVQENYYDKDLNYESFRSKRQNANSLATPVKIDFIVKERMVQIAFPKNIKRASGKVTFFRPSNKTLDKTLELNLNEEGVMKIPVTDKMLRGRWKVQVDWKSDGREYFSEESIVI